jgi:hypothetical protein
VHFLSVTKLELCLLGFMSRWWFDPSVRAAAQAEVLAPNNVPTMILFETRGLRLYWVVRGGIEYVGDSGVELAAHARMS